MSRKMPKTVPLITPEMEAEIQKLARQEIARLLLPVLQMAGMQVAVSQTQFVLNPEARRILEMDHDTLMSRIRSGHLIEGIHFQGSGRRRSWRVDRLERYRSTEGDQSQQIRDISQWQKEGFAIVSSRTI